MCTEPTRYTAPAPRVAFQANARVCASGCVESVPTATEARTAATSLAGKRRLEIIKAPLDAMRERRVEVDAVAEIPNQVGDGKAARVLQHLPHGERAGRVR